MSSPHPLSLLWPDVTQRAQASTALDPQCIRDLDVESVISAMIGAPLGRSTLRQTFLTLCTDTAAIVYRQDILDDLWRHPAFVTDLEALLPDMSTLDASQPLGDRRRLPLLEVSWRLGELERLVTCVSGLDAVFQRLGDGLQAAGWQTLRQRITHLARDPVYQNLCRELPDMLQTMRAKASVTIGVNLDGQLQPVAATLLSINDQKFTASSFLDRLLGRDAEPFKGQGPLHTVPPLVQSGGPPGSQRALKRALLAAYHGQGRNPGARDVLVELAGAVGLPVERAQEVLDRGEFADAVRQAEHFWQEVGIHSVPAVIVNRKHLISGGQPHAVFEQALREIAAEGTAAG